MLLSQNPFFPLRQFSLSSLERLNLHYSHTYANKMQAFKRCLKACKRLKIGLLGLFSCYLGMLSKKVLSSELSKVVRKIQFALFRKIGFPKNSYITPTLFLVSFTCYLWWPIFYKQAIFHTFFSVFYTLSKLVLQKVLQLLERNDCGWIWLCSFAPL